MYTHKGKGRNLQWIRTHNRQIASLKQYYLARWNCWSEAGAIHLQFVNSTVSASMHAATGKQ